jgi:hypothetical protein
VSGNSVDFLLNLPLPPEQGWTSVFTMGNGWSDYEMERNRKEEPEKNL